MDFIGAQTFQRKIQDRSTVWPDPSSDAEGAGTRLAFNAIYCLNLLYLKLLMKWKMNIVMMMKTNLTFATMIVI